ncbi:hypothetical protein ES705_24865 [subsurface metagenome]
MTIDEAITHLEQERTDHHSLPTDLTGQALVLGIEALMRVKTQRISVEALGSGLLPGETE